MDKFTLLKQYFGHDAFRPGQEAMIDALLAGGDALAIVPCTGNTLGKLACGITDTSVTRRAVFAGGGAAPAPTAPLRSQGHAGREQ